VLSARALCLLLAFAFAASCGGRADGQKGDGSLSKGEEKQAGPVVYVALGDSTGVGVGAGKGGGYVARLFERVERARPGSRLVNLCASGATTADLLRSQLPRVAAARPTLITLGIGINDVTHGVSPEQFARNYEEIVAGLRRQEGAQVVATNIPDIARAPAVSPYFHEEVGRRIALFNKHIAEASERHGVLLLDMHAKSRDIIPKHKEFFSADGFHPSEAGYEFWAFEMWPTVKRAIGEGRAE